MAPFLVLERLAKSFGGQRVLRDVSLQVEEGEVLALLGSSGSGKTTLLRLIAGFETPDGGAIRVEREEVTDQPPERRNFGMVFQHYALFPHLTVGDNVAFGLESRKLPVEEVRRRVTEVLELVDLAGFQRRRVQEISGGQQQRVALARALAPHPRLLLLDEPLSNLDPDLRERTRRQLRGAVRRVGLTGVWVTHEQEEAFDVGDRIALLQRGAIAQVGRPEELYLRPKSRFVAGFVGRASFLSGRLTADGRVRIGDEGVPGHGVSWPAVCVGELSAEDRVEVLLRPEALVLAAPGRRDALVGSVEERRFSGEATYLSVALAAGGRVLVRAAHDAAPVGAKVGVTLEPGGPPPRVFLEQPEDR